jgi:hypothetical protein
MGAEAQACVCRHHPAHSTHAFNRGCSIGDIAFRDAELTTVPERATFALLASGFVGIGLIAKLRRSWSSHYASC